MTKQTRITIQTDSLLLFQGRNSPRIHCPECNTESNMVALQNLQVISNLDRADLDDWINSGELHRVQVNDGSFLICLNSLLSAIHRMPNR